MRFESKVSLRFLIDGKTQTLFILMGIAFGIAVQIFLSAIITGVQQNLIDKTIGTSAHITVRAPSSKISETGTEKISNTVISRSAQEDKNITDWEKIVVAMNKMKGISTAAPLAQGSGFVSSGARNIPVIVRGVDTVLSNKIYRFTSRITQGSSAIDANNVLIGNELATDMNISEGETIRIVTAEGVSDLFIVSGIFDFGNQNANSSWIFMNLSRAQKFLNLNANVSTIEVQLNDPFESETISVVLRKLFTNMEFETWQETNQSLLSALSSQSSSSDIIQVFIILAVALGISSVLAVSVVQKSRQIGILKAMGTTDKSIGLIFILQGFALGFIGGLLGCLLAAVLIWLFILMTSSGEGIGFTIQLDSNMLIFSIAVSTISSILAAFLPSLRSIKLSPIEVIKNG